MKEYGSTYYTIHEFMTDLLELRGSRLLVYALIYSFSRDGAGEFRGSREYISASTGLSTRTVDSVLGELVREGLVERLERPLLHTKYAYRVSFERIEWLSKRRTDEIQLRKELGLRV